MSDNPKPSREDILYAFAVEPTSDRETLERYLSNYPEYSAELIDLSYELSCDGPEDNSPLSDQEIGLIDRLWQQHTGIDTKNIIDPFANLTVATQRQLARQLDIPRQVLTAFREHKVEPNSIPSPFLERLASTLNITMELLVNALGQPPQVSQARSYKSDARPEINRQVSIEQVLIEAEVPPDKRMLLMKTDK